MGADVRFLIVGAGAVGGYVGSRLSGAGSDVTFLVRQGKAAELKERGLRVRYPDGSTSTTWPKTVTAPLAGAPWDVVVLAVKSTALASTLDDIAPIVGPGTMLLPLLNGVAHFDILTRRFPGAHVLGGIAVMATHLDADGTITQIAPGATVTVGELDGSDDAQLDALASALSAADLTGTISSSVLQDLWEKWYFMTAGGAATVLLGGPVGALMAAEAGRDAVLQVIAEVGEVHRAAGHPPRPEAVERVSSTLTADGSPFTTSLYRDDRAGRPTEVEAILGDALRLAQANAVPAPLVLAATVRLRVRAEQHA